MTTVTTDRRSALLLLVCSIAGMTAAVALTIEKFEKMLHPDYVPSCNISPILSCGQVMMSHQAAVFGFPNPILGLPSYAVVITVAVVAMAGVALPRWIWGGLSAVSLLAVGFICWLIFQSLYRINALCPYCMVVWAITPIILITAVNQTLSGVGGVLRYVAEWRWTLLTLWYAIVALLAFLRFPNYWLSLI